MRCDPKAHPRVRKAGGLCTLFMFCIVAFGCDPSPPKAEDDPALRCTEALVRGTRTQYVIGNLGLPNNRIPSTSEDFDGDGRLENKFYQLVQIAAVAEIDVQPAIDAQLRRGEGVILLELTAPDLQNADCASLTVLRAKPPQPGLPPPKFQGGDFFIADRDTQVTLYGAIRAGVFHSVRPSAQPAADKRFAVDLTISANDKLTLPLRGFSIETQLVDSPSGPAMTTGSLRGALAEKDIYDQLTTKVANLLTAIVNNAANQSEEETLIKIIEYEKSEVSQKKCEVVADCCRLSYKTCKLLPQEVLASPLGGLFTSDVHVFDDAGNWHPDPLNKEDNGMSFGLRFEAISAAF